MPIPEQLGPFKLTRLLGRGGMGAVYKAEHNAFPVPLALKVLLSQSENDSVRLDRFNAEIDALRRLRHPNIVRLIGYGEADGYRYFAMEYIDGPSLEAERKNNRRFTWEETVHVGVHTARALRHSHNRGIVHRDIKPANILVDSSGQIKVSDYGIAHLFGGERVTAVDSVIGTLDYMAPEQASAGPITPKTDLYSLGALLYALLAGVGPYPLEKKSLPALLNKFREGPPESVRFRRPDVPRDLDELLLELLQVPPEKRPPNAMIVQRRLESILEKHAVTGGLARYFDADSSEEEESRTAEAVAGEGVSGTTSFFLSGDTVTSQGDEPAEPDLDRTKTTRVLSENEDKGNDSALNTGLTLDATGSGVFESDYETGVSSRPTEQFIRVSEEEYNPYTPSEERSPFLSLRVLIFSSVLLLAGIFFAYALRRPSADTLYGRMEQKIAGVSELDGSDYFSALRSMKGDIQTFLTHYPNDPRAGKVRELDGDLEFAALENRLTRQAERSRFRTEPLSVIESAYVEAFREAERDPEKGIEKFRAFLKIYDHELDDSPSYSLPHQCVHLAQKRLELLEKLQSRQDAQDRELVESQLKHAAAIEENDPECAAQIREGLKEFYGGRSWAGDYFGKTP